MTHWLYPANTKFYDVFGAFDAGETYWPVSSKIEAGDIVIIYLAAPYKQIGYVCDVMDVGLAEGTVIDHVRPFFKKDPGGGGKSKSFMKLKVSSAVPLKNESMLGLPQLKRHGLNGMLMGPRKLENNPSLLKYIKGHL